MRSTICLLLLIILLSGCKKETDSEPDYSCNCQPYGKNVLSLIFSQTTALYPYENEKHRWGFIDESGSAVIGAVYADAWSFSNNRAMIVDDKNGVQFAGFIDPTGSIAITPRFRLISESLFSSEGLAPIGDSKINLFGYINLAGEVIIPFQFRLGLSFHDGMAVILSGDRLGAIDVTGRMAIPCQYESMSMFSEGLALAFVSGVKPGYINHENLYKIQGDFTDGSIFLNGLAAVKDFSTRLIGFIDTSGQFVIPPKFSDAYVFSEGLAAMEFLGKWGFINKYGNFVIQPQYEDVCVGFCNGLAPVKKNSQWGYIDQTGKFVISPQFFDADLFYCNLAKVWFIDGTAGYINKTGKVVYHSTQSFKGESNFPKIANALEKFNIRIGKGSSVHSSLIKLTDESSAIPIQ